MPNSINIPFTMISDPISNLMLSPTQLLTLFREHNVDVEKPTICSCGSGMTACGLIFSLHLVGKSSCLYGVRIFIRILNLVLTSHPDFAFSFLHSSTTNQPRFTR
eukprot:Sdes_comp20484_c0_seq1m14839